MARSSFRFGTALALAASLSLTASPVMARDNWRHRDRGIDAGDVLAGVLIIGGIAAIASAASKSDRDREEDYRAPPPPPRQVYYDDRPRQRSTQGRGFDDAVDTCVDQVERGDERVASVDAASRGDDGWRVSGALSAGGGFSCWIDNDGRVRNIDLGGDYYQGSSNDAPSGAQWDDDAYANARAQQRQAEAGDYPEIDGDLAASGY